MPYVLPEYFNSDIYQFGDHIITISMSDTVARPVPAAASPAAKKKVAVAGPSRQKKAAPAHPSTSVMVTSAIKELNEKKGSSLSAIKKYLSANYKVDTVKYATFIRKYLKGAVTNGTIVQTKGTFKLPVAEVKPKKKKKVAAKKKAPPPAVKRVKKVPEPYVMRRSVMPTPVQQKTVVRRKKTPVKSATAPVMPKKSSVKPKKPVTTKTKAAAAKPKKAIVSKKK